MKHNRILCAVLAACIVLTSGCKAQVIGPTDTAQAAGAATTTSESTTASTQSTEKTAPPADTTAAPTSQEAPTDAIVQTAEAYESAETAESTAEADETTEAVISESSGNIGEIELHNGDLIAVIDIQDYGRIKAKLFPEIAPVGVDNFVKLAAADYYDGLNIHRVIADFMLQGGSLNGDGTGGEAADGGTFGVEINEAARHFYGALCYANAQGLNTTQFYIVNNKQTQDLSLLPSPAELRETAEIFLMQSEMSADDPVYFNYYRAMADYYYNLARMLENATPEVIERYTTEGGTPSLDGGYTVFGQVYDGFDVIDSISACEVKASAYDELSVPVNDIIITDITVIEYDGTNG